MRTDLILIIDNVRSVQNTASLFRTADCAGVDHIYLLGTTPAPNDRFGRTRSDFVKISLGAEASVPWEYVEDGEALVQMLKDKGIAVVVLEQDSRALPYTQYTPQSPIALVVGAEREGVSPYLRACADAIIEIPMRGKKESLNVAVAGGIALFRLAELRA